MAEIEITASPRIGEIQLDGNFVGGTLSTIGVSAGDHVIEINKNGYRPSERKLKTSNGKLTIAPTWNWVSNESREPKPLLLCKHSPTLLPSVRQLA
jgi:hypothetical protein